jgi:hypothetical protein
MARADLQIASKDAAIGVVVLQAGTHARCGFLLLTISRR